MSERSELSGTRPIARGLSRKEGASMGCLSLGRLLTGTGRGRKFRPLTANTHIRPGIFEPEL